MDAREEEQWWILVIPESNIRLAFAIILFLNQFGVSVFVFLFIYKYVCQATFIHLTIFLPILLPICAAHLIYDFHHLTRE